MDILITGGTTFVSKCMAEYFVARGDSVFVLNRNTKPQPNGVTLIQADRNALGGALKNKRFDAVIDVNAYNASYVNGLLDALDGFDRYILISSSAVYPETAKQPFKEDTPVGANKFWGAYGLGKIQAEQALAARVADAHIIRPPYIYGKYNNVYREAFVFDCALANRPFYVPNDGSMKLQFFDVRDLCRFADILLSSSPAHRVFNVGGAPVSILDFVKYCYSAAGKDLDAVYVTNCAEQRDYFPFYDYEYELDVSEMRYLMPDITPLEQGFAYAFKQYVKDRTCVKAKNYIKYIDDNLARRA